MATNYNSYDPYGVGAAPGAPNIPNAQGLSWVTGGISGNGATKSQPVPSYPNSGTGYGTYTPNQPVPTTPYTPSPSQSYPQTTFNNTSTNPGTPTSVDQFGNWYNPSNNTLISTNPNTPGRDPNYTPASTTPSFADPAYQQLNDLVSKRLGTLANPAQFPILTQLQQLLGQVGPQAQQRAQSLADTLTARATQLNQPLLTDANVANQRALASNNLLASRDTALANSRANLAARGINPNTSGLQIDQANQINQQAGNQQAQIDAQLQEQQIQGDENRRNEATQLGSLATQALQGGDLTAIQDAAQNADLENQLFNIGQNQQREALTTAQIPVDLTNQGFSNAVNASTAASNPLSAIMSLLSLGNSQQGLQQVNDNSNASALAWLLQTALA